MIRLSAIFVEMRQKKLRSKTDAKGCVAACFSYQQLCPLPQPLDIYREGQDSINSAVSVCRAFISDEEGKNDFLVKINGDRIYGSEPLDRFSSAYQGQSICLRK